MSRVDDIKARAAAATPGPWGGCDDCNTQGWHVDTITVMDMDGSVRPEQEQGQCSMLSRDDIDWLVARVEELSAALRETRTRLVHHITYAERIYEHGTVGYDRQEAEVAAITVADAALRNLEDAP